MADLNQADRDKLSSSQFAGPNRTFPIPDKKHARLAIAMAHKSYNAGNIGLATRDSIIRKAKRKLGMSND